MEHISVNQFRHHLKTFVEKVIEQHQPLKVTRRFGEDFIVMSAEDWARQQETLFVLENTELMQQIKQSIHTHNQHTGYHPNQKEIDEIISI